MSNPWTIARAALSVATLLFAASASAQETVCAQVKIEIQQELTLERQAFDAMMRITNGLDTTALENVDITVSFKDEAGNSVLATSDPNNTTAAFFIRLDTMDGINNVTGTGRIEPRSVAEIHWLIIPAPGSGGTIPSGKLYYVGATLDYTFGGKAETVTVTPDFIYVKPMPLLTLDYFLTQDVFGDDPLTAEVEPVEPYTLGVRIKNTGAATAKNIKIDSAQPKIVENNQGLLINFQIIGSTLNDQPASPSLLIPFGDVPANGATNGRWIMTSSLAGRFIDFSASFSHADELGGAVTSLLQATNAHLLVRDVKVDLPGRDNVRDFLALDGSVVRLYESSGVDTVVSNLSSSSVLTATGNGPAGEALYALTAPASAGVMYVQLPDPFGGTRALGRVTRSDGKVMAPENVWLSKRRNADKSLEYFFNLFDANTTGVYNVALTTPSATPRPPVIQFISDRTVTEGTQVSFLVEASDPDGTLPTLTVSSLLPNGASFFAEAPADNTARAVFDWTPGTGQAGRYPITFTASDGALSASMTAVITVANPIAPGGPDAPTIASPAVATSVAVLAPVLSVAASANPLDTATGYQFELYSDPQFTLLVAQNPTVTRTPAGASWEVPTELADNTHYYWRVRAADDNAFSPWATGRFFVNTANDAPDAVALAAPANGTTVASTAPVLSLANTTDPDGDTVTYGIEIYADGGLTQKVAEVANLAGGAGGITSWAVTPALADTTLYYWRGIATDPHGAKSISAIGSFLVDLSRPAPGVPQIAAPAVGGTVSTANVALTVANSTRPDGTVLSYYFELDRNANFAGAHIVRSGARPEGTDVTVFAVTGLAENARYYWRAKSSDGLADSPWAYGEFFVDQANDAPSVPTPKNPGDGSWQTSRTPLLEVNPSVDPEGDAIAYRFEIYGDAALTQRVAERLTNGLAWLLDSALTDDARYYWRVRAEDLRGGVSDWSAASSFLVRTGSATPTRASLALTAPASIVQANATTAAIAWEITDPEHDASIALYYDSDRQGEDGTGIISELSQDPSSTSGSYNWNLAELPPGTYYIYATATNRAGSTTVYAPGAIVIPVPEPRGGISVTPVSGLETNENGGTATFTVSLTLSPRADVTIGLTSTHAAEGRVDPPQLVFTPANWSAPRTVTVTGLPDCIDDGDTAYQVITGKAVSADHDYNGVKGADVALVNRHSIVGCPSNNSPFAHAGPDQTVDAGAQVVLTGSGTDSDGAVATYRWTQTAGPDVTLANPDAAITSFTAPSLVSGASLAFQLTVTDNEGATATDDVAVTVRARVNQAPVANAGADQTVVSGQHVTLSGSGTDADGTIAAYAWVQIAGPGVALSGANAASASFTAPAVSQQTVFGFQLTVTDNDGATGSAIATITVVPNQPPVANAGPDQNVAEGAAVTLTGSGTDADGTIATYQWTQTAGPTVTLANANSATATFVAPSVTADTVLTFRLTVTDNAGASASATTNVTVHNVNQPPAANAGADQTVEAGLAVTLAGSGSDNDGTIASYAWIQTAGPAVTLAGAATATASFTAPSVASATVLTFQLTVTDNENATASDTVDITVTPPSVPGVDLLVTALAPSRTTVDVGESVTIAYSVRNQGVSATSTATRVRFYASTDATITTGDRVISTQDVPSLAGGASSSGEFIVTVPATFTPGTYYVGAIADFDNVQPESNEANNAYTGPAVTVIRVVDLVVTALTSSRTTVDVGESVTIAYTVTNQGTSVTSTETRLRFYASTDPTITADDRVVSTQTVPNLAGGASASGEFTVTVPATFAPGTYYVGAIADFDNVQPETDEANNVHTGPAVTVIRAVDLLVTALTPSSTTVSRGQSVTISYTVTNQGTSVTSTEIGVRFYASTDSTITAADVAIGTQTVPNLAGGASSSGAFSVTVPATFALGTYYVGAIADVANVQPETNEDNNSYTGPTVEVRP